MLPHDLASYVNVQCHDAGASHARMTIHDLHPNYLDAFSYHELQRSLPEIRTVKICSLKLVYCVFLECTHEHYFVRVFHSRPLDRQRVSFKHVCIALAFQPHIFVHFFPGSFLSSIHGSDYGMDNLLLGGGLGEVGEGLAALELGVLDDTCVEDVVLV